jgi:hypothetical protein
LRRLRWERQSKAFEAVDLVLVLILFGLSNECSLRAFFKCGRQPISAAN